MLAVCREEAFKTPQQQGWGPYIAVTSFMACHYRWLLRNVLAKPVGVFSHLHHNLRHCSCMALLPKPAGIMHPPKTSDCRGISVCSKWLRMKTSQVTGYVESLVVRGVTLSLGMDRMSCIICPQNLELFAPDLQLATSFR